MIDRIVTRQGPSAMSETIDLKTVIGELRVREDQRNPTGWLERAIKDIVGPPALLICQKPISIYPDRSGFAMNVGVETLAELRAVRGGVKLDYHKRFTFDEATRKNLPNAEILPSEAALRACLAKVLCVVEQQLERRFA